MRKDKEPDAYGLLDEGDVWYATPFRSEAEGVLARTGDTESAIVSLYRQPTLTDEERAAIKACESDYSDNDMDPACWKIAATLRGLLERLGGNR